MASLFPRRLFSPSICSSCRSALVTRTFTTTSIQRNPPLNATRGPSLADQIGALSTADATDVDDIMSSLIDGVTPGASGFRSTFRRREADPYRLHVYATKHNCHITLTGPNNIPQDQQQAGPKDPSPKVLLTLSSGNIGFRKAGRGSYDAAYQLAAYVLKSMRDRNYLNRIERMEVVMRGFGPGREAVSKAILGSEGKNIRNKIVGIRDATRLKFGGTRSPNPRRLG